jgi:ADP-ribose pyrophosphatase YjhB (NUDIX family)
MSDRIRLATGLVVRNGCVLLVASTYPSYPQPLWNLPGGRVAAGELLHETVVREIAEETGLRARVTDLAYVSESYDGKRNILNATFAVETSGAIALPAAGDHVVGVEWVPIDALAGRIAVAVVREPLIRYLRDRTRYYGFANAGISIEWPDEVT